MTADEVKTALAKAARRCWPNVTKASDLPFPDYWKAVTEWLAFHAPHIGDELLWKLIDNFAVSAKEAEESGIKPAAPKVPERVREIWNRAVGHRSKTLKAGTTQADAAQDAWEHAAERAEEVRTRFAARHHHDPKDSTCGGRPERRPYQGRLL